MINKRLFFILGLMHDIYNVKESSCLFKNKEILLNQFALNIQLLFWDNWELNINIRIMNINKTSNSNIKLK